jgi:hypothetical protein
VATVRAVLHADDVGVDGLVTANAWEGNERLAESVAALVGLAPAAFVCCRTACRGRASDVMLVDAFGLVLA